MDPFTHTLVGVCLSRTRAARRVRQAGAAAIVGANLPDIDVISLLQGSDVGLGFRRGWTHGPPALLILPLIWIGILFVFDRIRRGRKPDLPALEPGKLLGWCYLGCLTHPLLDWLNTYGIRFLMPFDGSWFYGDALFIIDPWLWLILGGALYLSSESVKTRRRWLVAGLVATAIIFAAGERVPVVSRVVWLSALVALGLVRHRVTVRPGRLVAGGLLLALLYIGGMVTTSHLSAGWVRGVLPSHGVPRAQRLMLTPRPTDPTRWSVLVEARDHYRHGMLYLRPWPRLELVEAAIPKSLDSPVVVAAMGAPEIAGTLSWMRFPWARVEASAKGYTVRFFDARYVRRPREREGFGSASVRLDRALQLLPAGSSPPTAE